MPQSDHTFATFARKHIEKQLFADETALLEAPDRVCPEEHRHGPPVGEGRFPALCVAGIQGGLFLDSEVSRLKMTPVPNCGVVSNVGSFPPFTPFIQMSSESVRGLVSIPKVPPCHCLSCSPSSAHVSPPRDQLGTVGPLPVCGVAKRRWELNHSSSGWH